MSDGHKKVCVIAWPAGHSRSPLIHNYWIKQHKLDAEYLREAVPPEAFADFIKSMRANGYVGANVTVPHKEAVLKLSEPDERARAVGAANALWFDDDRLRSTNTDVEGFLANLDAATPGWDRGLSTAVVLGAGGGARAVVFALLAARSRPHLCDQPHRGARKGVTEKVWRARAGRRLGGNDRPARWCRTAGQHHHARNGGPAAA